MSKYIRTKTGVYKVLYRESMPIGFMYHIEINPRTGSWKKITDKSIVKEADDIEKLFDEKVIIWKDKRWQPSLERDVWIEDDERKNFIETIYGAIWTSKGLIHVAKLNDKGKWELI